MLEIFLATGFTGVLMILLSIIIMIHINVKQAPEEGTQIINTIKSDIEILQNENRFLKTEVNEIKEILKDQNKVIKDLNNIIIDQGQTIDTIGKLFNKLDGLQDAIKE